RFYWADQNYKVSYDRHLDIMNQGLEFRDGGEAYFSSTEGLSDRLSEKAIARVALLLPDKCSRLPYLSEGEDYALETKTFVFISDAGREMKSKDHIVVVAFSEEDKEYTVIDPWLGIRGRGDSVIDAMENMVDGGVYNGVIKEMGTYYYEKGGALMSVLAEDDSLIKQINENVEDNFYLFMFGKWPMVAYWGWQAFKAIYDAYKTNDTLGSESSQARVAVSAAIFTVSFGFASARGKPGKILISKLLGESKSFSRFADKLFEATIGKGDRVRRVTISKWLDAGQKISADMLTPTKVFDVANWIEGGGLVGAMMLDQYYEYGKHENRKCYPHLDCEFADEFAEKGMVESSRDNPLSHLERLYGGDKEKAKKKYDDVCSRIRCFNARVREGDAETVLGRMGIDGLDPLDMNVIVSGVQRRLITQRAKTLSELKGSGDLKIIARFLGLTVEETVDLYLNHGGPADSPEEILKFCSKNYKGVKSSDLPSIMGYFAGNTEKTMRSKAGVDVDVDMKGLADEYRYGFISLEWLKNNAELEVSNRGTTDRDKYAAKPDGRNYE
ncbi:MAG: hypothetical protein ABIG39_06015, partial [Candidatus Micrarchaeota archaeon]